MIDAPTQRIDTTYSRIAYRDVGQGPVLLCLHGTGPGASGMGNYAETTEDLAPDFRVIVPDFPGFGDSEITVDDPMPWCRRAALEMLELLKKLDIRTAHIVGNSAGGTVALHMALVDPGAVKSLVLSGPAGLRLPMFTPSAMEGVRMMRSYQQDPSLEKMRALLEGFLYDPSVVDIESLARKRYEETRSGGTAGNARIARDFPRGGLKISIEELNTIATPTLLIWGREERVVGIDDAMVFLASMQDVRLLLLAKCGHWVPIEKRTEFVAQVRAFTRMVDARN